MQLPALSIENLTVGSARRTLLAGINMDLAPGELLGLTGPSGCGKTTLLRTIAGLIDAVAGTIHFFGADTPGAGGWPAYRRQVPLVDQRPVLLDDTVESNLKLPFTYKSAAANEYPQAQAIELMDRLAVGAQRMDQHARSLSVGQQQRVCLIRALLLRPKVILLDEPTSALDGQAAELVERLIRQYAEERGLAGLIVLHDTRQALRWCDRVIDLRPMVVEQVEAATVKQGAE